jgi:hypothetical protein
MPITLKGGYRFPYRRIVPYVGGGIGSYRFDEHSEFDEPEDNATKRHMGYIINGGVELRVTRLVGLAGDVQYASVANGLGQGGVSKDFGENNLGGVSLSAKVVVGR